MYFSPALIAAFATLAYGANTGANTGNTGATGTTGTGATGTGTASATGATQTVLVAQNNQLQFTPNTVTANVGDSVQYQFTNGNHTVTAGTMTAGCTPGGAGFASGFVAVNNNPTQPKTINGNLQGNQFLVQGTQLQQQQQQQAKNGQNKIRGTDNIFERGIWGRAANGNPTFTVQVASTNPQPVYCNQQLHCQQGPMVMMINGNAQQLSQYQQLAQQAKANVIANGPTGGTLAGKTLSNNNNGNANQQAQQQQQQAQQQQQQAQQQQQQAQQQQQQAQQNKQN